MQPTEPSDYFRRRAEQECSAADNAAEERAAQVHRILAEELQRRADEGAPLSPEEHCSPGILSSEFRILP